MFIEGMGAVLQGLSGQAVAFLPADGWFFTEDYLFDILKCIFHLVFGNIAPESMNTDSFSPAGKLFLIESCQPGGFEHCFAGAPDFISGAAHYFACFVSGQGKTGQGQCPGVVGFAHGRICSLSGNH